jgi:hypothetical protein
MMGVDYSIADIPLLGWERNLIGVYKRATSSASTALLEVELMLRGVIHELRRQLRFRQLANEIACREIARSDLRDWS